MKTFCNSLQLLGYDTANTKNCNFLYLDGQFLQPQSQMFLALVICVPKHYDIAIKRMHAFIILHLSNFISYIELHSVQCDFFSFQMSAKHLLSKTGTYSSKHVCVKSFIKKSTCHQRKVIPMAKFINQYKIQYCYEN